jgi:hypothetical protein
MSNSKEKAKELVNKFYIEGDMLKESHSYRLAKKCALIAVDEIRSCINWNHYPLDREWRFWDEVKQEIEKL